MEATDIRSAKAKLKATTGDELVREFNRMLADRLNDEMIPDGVVLAIMLLEYDLEKGVDGYTGKPLNTKLQQLPGMFIRLVSRKVLRKATDFFPEEFAKEMLQAYEETLAAARATEAPPAENAG